MRFIQVGNLPDSFDGPALRRLFESHGAVRSATINRHHETWKSTGVGFVEMESDEGGTTAIAALNQREHLGRVLSVCWTGSADGRFADRHQMFGPMNMTNGNVNELKGDGNDRD